MYNPLVQLLRAQLHQVQLIGVQLPHLQVSFQLLVRALLLDVQLPIGGNLQSSV